MKSGFGILKFEFDKEPMRFLLAWVILLGFTLPGVLDARQERSPILAILPFSIARTEAPGKGVVCPVCKGIRRSGEIVLGAEKTLTELLYTKLEAKGAFQVIPYKKIEENLLPSERKLTGEISASKCLQIGKKLKADFILIGNLFLFEERKGSSLGVERPASVGFDLHLFRLRDEKMAWIGKFDETQRPLSENLLKIGSFIRRKGSWMTASELANVGMDEMLEKLPGLKELEEGL